MATPLVALLRPTKKVAIRRQMVDPDTLSNPSFMYTKVEYLDEKGVMQYHLISKDRAVDNVVEDTIRAKQWRALQRV